jgi:hypothetical protein
MTITRRYFYLFVGCLLIDFLMRLPNLLALPAHTDEGEYLLWAQWAWQGDPLHMLEQGKVLIIGLTALIGPFTGGLFIARYMVLLTGAIGVASAYVVGRKLHSPQAGLIATLLWLGTPQLIFFERMSLHDIPMASMGILTLWLALRMMDSTRWQRAAWCGIGLALCVAAKTTGIIFLSIPILVLLFWRGAIPMRAKVRQVIISIAVFALIWMIPTIYIVSVGADPFYMSANRPANPATISSFNALIERVQTNLIRMVQAERTYLTLVLLILLPLAMLVLIRRNRKLALLLLALIAVVFVSIAVAASKLWLRYIVPATPFMLVLIAVGLAYWLQKYRGRQPSLLLRRAAWLIVIGFVLLVGVPYAITAQTAPAQLAIPETDNLEYVQWLASGYGVREAVEYLSALPQPITAMGTAGDCYGGRAMIREPQLTLICPSGETWWDDANTAYVQSIHDRAASDGYVLIIADETAPIITPDRLPQPLRIVRVFQRPGGAYNVVLYCAGADPQQRCPQ